MDSLSDIEEDNVVDMTQDDDQDLKEGTKRKASKKPGGTFASMNLCRPVLKAIERKGYKLATPIQRKCIPSIMTGRDVVAMARTGSGKSAAFLLPLIDKLKIRQPKSAIRALVLSPTRELALQTFKFAREFSRYTNLVTKLVIGGESISKDFETLTSSPDILVATPGRLAHVLVEMKLKLNDLEIVVLDEADRLFEPGFKEIEQVNEICNRLPESKQTLLFSATMPQRLADFAKVGLNNPLFIRLDVDTNLSDTLKTIYLHCAQHDKFAILVHLLKKFVNNDQMIVVFLPTKHHIEYAKTLLGNANIDSCYVYSSLDSEARKINIDKFSKKNCKVMLVTDIAARGIDIPILDIVINYNFPFKPKLFIHRVGRVARAGRFGCAISLVSHDETPYLHALHIFLGLPLNIASSCQDEVKDRSLENIQDKVLGSVPQTLLDEGNESLKLWHDHDDELKSLSRVCDNAMKPYIKSREPPTPFSVKTAKEIHRKVIGIHPIFLISSGDNDVDNNADIHNEGGVSMLDRIRAYKPQSTIFEVSHIKGNRRTEAYEIMQKKRQFHSKKSLAKDDDDPDVDIDPGDGKQIQIEVNMKKGFQDSKYYLNYQPENFAKEKGLELDKNVFNNELNKATLDIVADDEDQIKRQHHQTVWDRKRKKYVKSDLLNNDKKTKKIKTESGALISASYQSGLFEKWKTQSKFAQRDSDDEMDNTNKETRRGRFGRKGSAGKAKTGRPSLKEVQSKFKKQRGRRELKNVEEIFKQRSKQEKIEAILRRKTQKKAKKFTPDSGKATKGGSSRFSRRRGRASSNTSS